jgi:hypothetical protein
MELILTLFRNLLAIPNEHPHHVTAATNDLARLQEDLIVALHEANVFEMLLLFAQVHIDEYGIRSFDIWISIYLYIYIV